MEIKTILKMTPMLKNMQCESQDEENQMQCTRVSVFPLWLPLNDACKKNTLHVVTADHSCPLKKFPLFLIPYFPQGKG